MTEPWAERFLANVRVGLMPVASMVEALVTAVDARSEPDVVAIRREFFTRDREAIVGVNRPTPVRYGRSPGIGVLGIKILRIASRVRGTFLRHADARLEGS